MYPIAVAILTLGAAFHATSAATAPAVIEQIERRQWSQNQATGPAKPPPQLIEKGGCPFEGCTYGRWIAEKPVVLRKSASTASVMVGKIIAGEHVTALTGEVHTLKPGRFRLTRDEPSYKLHKGDLLWVYAYLGEGAHTVWVNGQWHEMSLFSGNFNPGHHEYHYGYFEQGEPVSVWWVRLRTAAGVEGWTDRPQLFDCSDALGYSEACRKQ